MKKTIYSFSLLCVTLISAHAQNIKPKVSSDADNATMLPDITVSEMAPSSMRVDRTSSGTGIETPVEEIPFVVDSLTPEVLNSRMVQDVREALELQSGVFTDGQSQLSRTAGMYTLRGRAGSEATINGLPLPSGMGIEMDASALERIDIVKGPVGGFDGGQTSTLGAYGAGGSVNLVLKEPAFDKFFDFNQSVRLGGEQRYRTYLDYNTYHGNTAMRVVGSTTFERPFWAGSNVEMGEKYCISPIFKWQPNEDFNIVLTTNYQSSNTPSYQGIPVIRGQRLGDYDADYGNGSNRTKVDAGYVQVVANYKANKTWSFRAGLAMASSIISWENFYISPVGRGIAGYDKLLATGDGIYGCGWGDQKSTTSHVFVQSLATFKTGAVKHQGLMALDYTNKRTTGYSSFGNTIQAVNIYNPVPPVSTSHIKNASTSSFSDLGKAGFMVQEQAEWRKWRALIGARLDEHRSTEGSTDFAVSPRLGITYLWTPSVILFTNGTQTQAPNFGYRGEDNQELTNRWEATQYEGGVRVSPMEDCWITANFFYSKQTGTPELIAGSTDRYEASGSSESRGVELSVVGNITKQWSSFVSYSWISYKDLDKHQTFNRYPANSLSVWQTYTFAHGLLSDTKLGFGCRYASSYFITERGNKVDDSFTLPSYITFDASIEVPLKHFTWGKSASLRLAVYNILNRQYYPSSRGPTQCFPGTPRSMELSLNMSF